MQGPFYSDTYVYPRECQRINFCNGDTRSPWSTTSTKAHGHLDDWDKVMFEWGFNPEEATANGGCDIHTECVPAAVAEGRLATRSDPCGGGLGAVLVVRPRTLVFAIFGHRVFCPWHSSLGATCSGRASRQDGIVGINDD